MTFKTVPRNEVLLQLEQAKNKKEQRKILCDLLECSEKEFDVLVDKLTAEREANRLDPQEAVKIAPPVQVKKGEYSEREIETMRKLSGEGKSTAQIANILRRPPKNVSAKLASLKKEWQKEKESSCNVAENGAVSKKEEEDKTIMQDMESKNEDTSAEESQKERDAKVCAFLVRENQLLRAAALKATELAAIFAQLTQIGRN